MNPSRGPRHATRDTEIVDDGHGVVLRRVVVGALRTNCWALHGVGDRRALLVDPGDEPSRILDAVADLRIEAIALTHAHWDHVLAVPVLVDALGVPVLAHAGEQAVWREETDGLAARGHWDAGTATAALLAGGEPLRPVRPLWDGSVDEPLVDGAVLRVGALAVEVLHLPGHTPGGIGLRVPGHVLTGDTLFPGGPGLTGPQWPLSDFPAVLRSAARLLPPGADMHLHPGHGRSTTAGRERPQLACWAARGW